MQVVALFCFGLIIGSFLNAVLYRLWVGKSAMAGRSFCPHCTHQLSAKDLVPVLSFVWLRGKCRYCSAKISWQYPIVELVTALLFTVIYLAAFPHGIMTIRDVGQLLVYLIGTSFLIVIFVYDLLHYLILDVVTIPAIVVLTIGNLLLGLPWQSLVIGGLVGGGFFALLFFGSRGKWIGGGDIRMGMVMGVLLGWPLVVVGMFLAYVIGAIVGIGLLVSGKKSFGSKVPFGTFLAIGAYLAMLYGAQLWAWYWNVGGMV